MDSLQGNIHRISPFGCLRNIGAYFLIPFLMAVYPANGSSAKRNDASNTVVIGLLSDPGTLNPLVASSTQAQDIIGMLFMKLLEEENDFLHFKPRLAKSWEFSNDSLSIIFHLREGVTWSDGSPCTAEDVKFTWECQKDTLISWSGRHLKDRIDRVDVVDKQTVVFHFSERYPYQLMDANDGVILPRHILSKVAPQDIRACSFGRSPVGNGPFFLFRWSSGQFIELKSNRSYCEPGKPYLDRVVFRIVPDMLSLVAQLKTGEIDCLESLSPEAADEIHRNNPEIRIFRYPSRSMTFIAWNLKKNLFNSRAIRKALAMAIDRRSIIERVWRGYARECTSPMHPMLWAYDNTMEPLPYDPSRALGILREEGWIDSDGDGILDRNGSKFEFEMDTNYGNEQRIDVATMVQAQLAGLGIKVNIRVLEWNTFIDRIVKSRFESCVMGWKVGTRADLKEFWHSSAVGGGGFNISGYNDTMVDRLIDIARGTLGSNEARQLWSKCQRRIYNDQPFCFLAIPDEIVGLRDRFTNTNPSAISFFHNLRSWRLDAEGP